MRKAFFLMIALGAAALITDPALAEVNLGYLSKRQLQASCARGGGIFSDQGSDGQYACLGPKGTVSCTKDGKCTGTCDTNCGKARGVGGILANTPATKTQPLTPQKVTRTPGTAPTQPLTSQKITKSPATAPAQPLTQQKVTRSPATAPAQPMTTSPSLRHRDR